MIALFQHVHISDTEMRHGTGLRLMRHGWAGYPAGDVSRRWMSRLIHDAATRRLPPRCRPEEDRAEKVRCGDASA